MLVMDQNDADASGAFETFLIPLTEALEELKGADAQVRFDQQMTVQIQQHPKIDHDQGDNGEAQMRETSSWGYC